mgnify:CR=1 FL=1
MFFRSLCCNHYKDYQSSDNLLNSPKSSGRNARKFRVAGLEACTSGSFPSIAHGKAERVNKPPHAESQMDQADKRPPFCQLLWILEKPHLPAKCGKCRKVCTVSRQVEAGTHAISPLPSPGHQTKPRMPELKRPALRLPFRHIQRFTAWGIGRVGKPGFIGREVLPSKSLKRASLNPNFIEAQLMADQASITSTNRSPSLKL